MNQKQKYTPTAPQFTNGVACQWRVSLEFVSDDEQDGYIRQEISNADTRDEAIVEAMLKHMDEKYPFRGITVYQCVFIG